ncbi:Rne/Rng family ribonuclease [Microseira wollei]|uniref:Ribonuclease E and G n=1 Tax=Microseira wollei NIES-4236 TaxID=2530354 RepID=A0AAV3XLW7_9CYAN|nr:Rne/Rng family ribonuclease [Microseira wollei]GET41786.1 ribonuclease E and G [Microseira wollei NIES-4236]
MPKQIIIAEQHRIAAVFSEDQIQELVVATGTHQVGDIYLGMVENVLPGIDAAFVNIGDAERNGFIHVSDLGPLRLKRTAGAITELLTPQQKVLVQVMKEPTGSKGPRLTGNITLPGRYLVLMPFGRGVNLSRRIKNENERNRLRALAILIKPAGMGLLVRTEAEGRDEEAIIEDLETLQKQWEAIQLEAQSVRAPALLNRDDDFIQRVLRDMYSGDVNRIVVDSHTGVKRVKQQLLSWSGGRTPQGVLIDHHRDRIPVLEYFRVNAAIREALKPRVDLPSGGYIIIEPTEALTVVDVNSGSFTRSATARETVLWTNCEAATEIARQLRLRNLAGVIIVDFIDMDSRRDQLQVLEHFNKALKSDKARPQIAQLSELGLVELTRKRQGQNIYELFGRPCPTCGGLGHLVELPGEGEQKLNTYSPSLSSFRETTKERESPAPSKGIGETWRPVENRSGEEASRSPYRPLEQRSMPVTAPYSKAETFGQETTSDLDFAPGADLDDLDLSYHPNYQERGNSRRRRRRRIGFGEMEEESTGRGGMFSNQAAADTGADAEWESDTEPSPAPSFSPTPLKVGRPEISERQRPVKPETAPPEVITVEMTPEEQEVYALMGISPLVRLNRQVKNPKSAIVNVRLPGQGNDSQNDVAPRLRNEEDTSEIPRASSYGFEPSDFDGEPDFQSEPLTNAPLSDSDEETASRVDTGAAPSESDSGDSLIRRRRRRRSSAVDVDGER